MFTRPPTQHVSSFDFGVGAFVGIGSIVRLFLVCAAFGAEVTLTLTLGPEGAGVSRLVPATVWASLIG